MNTIILAGGRSSRMKSTTSKLLHKIGGLEVISHILQLVSKVDKKTIYLIHGDNNDLINVAKKFNVTLVKQSEPLGTGHALQIVFKEIKDASYVLVLNGDAPLITHLSLEKMITEYHSSDASLCVLTANCEYNNHYGKIKRINGKISEIVESSGYDDTEINAGVYLFSCKFLSKHLYKLIKNEKNEYFITDLIKIAYLCNENITSVSTTIDEVAGVNTLEDLALVERVYQRQNADMLMRNGIKLLDPNRIDVRGTLSAGQNCIIDINCIFIGDVVFGENVQIGAGCVIENTCIGDNVEIYHYSIIHTAVIKNNVKIGPFARIRPHTELMQGAEIGNFVEVKNSVLGKNSKVRHLSYIGDTEVGNNTNIGAGVVTCNYDGKSKHKTKIGNNVFIGSGSMLIAPLHLECFSTIGAGTVVTKDVKANTTIINKIKRVTKHHIGIIQRIAQKLKITKKKN